MILILRFSLQSAIEIIEEKNACLSVVAAFILIASISLTGCAGAGQLTSAITPASPGRTQATATPFATQADAGNLAGSSGDAKTATPSAIPPGTRWIPSTALPNPREAQIAIDDLAGRLDVAQEMIELISSSGDDFPASDLGCPNPKSPTRPVDALVTGQRVILSSGGVRYEYHVHGGRVAYCGTIPYP